MDRMTKHELAMERIRKEQQALLLPFANKLVALKRCVSWEELVGEKVIAALPDNKPSYGIEGLLVLFTGKKYAVYQKNRTFYLAPHYYFDAFHFAGPEAVSARLLGARVWQRYGELEARYEEAKKRQEYDKLRERCDALGDELSDADGATGQ